eukprot:scaffold76001_cov30-Tisochrysis_lutea.AAC.7
MAKSRPSSLVSSRKTWTSLSKWVASPFIRLGAIDRQFTCPPVAPLWRKLHSAAVGCWLSAPRSNEVYT